MFSYRSTIHFCNISKKYQHCAGKSMLLQILYRITSLTKGTVDLRGWIKSVLYLSTGFL
jgi:ABC-type polysaccharide/polyol phosphate transport system ATPase subunit